MEVVIKSILGKSTDDVEYIVSTIVDMENESLFSEQERIVFKDMANILKTSEGLPSEQFFLNKYPEYSVPLERAAVLEGNDLKIHFQQMVQKRNNQNASRVLMEVAKEVVSTGLTYELADKLHNLRVIDDIESEGNSLIETPDGFKEMYEKKKSQPKGMQTFIKEVDEKIGALPMGGVSVIFAYTGQFKTTWATNIAYNNSMKLNYNICIVSLEVSKEDVMYNILSRHSTDNKFIKYPAIPHQKIRQCELNENEEEYLMNVIMPDFYQSGGHLCILDETDFVTFSPGEIRKVLEREDDKCIQKTGAGFDAVIWDHANLFKFTSLRGGNTGDVINEYASFIRKLSIAFRRIPGTREFRKLCMLILAQANREGYKRAVKQSGSYDMRAISEANELERGSQQIFSIYTSEDLKLAKEALVQIHKNRTGAVMIDPVSIYVDPVVYVAGEELEGFSEMINTDELGELFEGNMDLTSLFD